MLPLKDLNRSLTTPHVNRLLIIANVIVFVVYWLSRASVLLNPTFAGNLLQNFSMVPAEIINGERLFTLFTSMFMHDPSSLIGGLLHLFGNMLYLYIFGDNIEDVFGHAGYVVFYLISGLVASLVFILSLFFVPFIGGLVGTPTSVDFTIGVVGASGAISGVLGAYLILYPKSKIISIVFYFILPVPAVIFLGFWFIMQWFLSFLDVSGGVAYWAHIGGFIAGMVLALAFGLKRKRAREKRLLM